MPPAKNSQSHKMSRLLWVGVMIFVLVIGGWVIRTQFIEFKNSLNSLTFEINVAQQTEKVEEIIVSETKKQPNRNLVSRAAMPKTNSNAPIDYQCDTIDFAPAQQSQWQQQIETLDAGFNAHNIVINDDLTVTLYAKSITPQFVKELQERLFYVYELYGSHFSIRAKRPINLKMIMLPDDTSYELFASMFIDNYVPGTSQGLYFHGSDSAFIQYKNEQQAMETTIHEAIHGLNFHLIGVMPRAINEGLAELFSSLVKSGANQANIEFDETNEKLKQYESFQTIVNSSKQWDANDTARYYMSGKLWLTFFFMEEKGLPILRAILREERKETCKILEEDDVLALVIDFNLNYEVDFQDWLNHHFLDEPSN